MDSTISVSKGVFVFKNGATKAKVRRQPQKCRNIPNRMLTEAQWYLSYQKTWSKIRDQLDQLQSCSYGKILDDLLRFVEGCYRSLEYEGVLPTAALLTGINQIDHMAQFEALAGNIRNNTQSLVVLLQSRDCPSMKAAVETLVAGFVEESRSSEQDDGDSRRLRRNQLNLGVLRAWYLEKHQHLDEKPNLTVIVPDFEVFSPEVLQDLLLVLNSYAAELPFVLVFGVATSVATIHSVLPYHVTSKIKLSIFQSEPSVANLNKVLESVFLTPYCPFHLSGNMFKLLTDIFLFYDFSVKGFVEGFKYALLEHFCRGPIYALCSATSDREELEEIVDQLSAADFESIRQLPSFRPLVESLDNPQEVIDFLTKDDYLRRMLPSILLEVHNFWFNFHCSMEMLLVLVHDLPKAPLGKQLRELYCHCISTDVTQTDEYRQCMQMVSFMSKEELLAKILAVMEICISYVGQNDEASNRGVTIFEVQTLEEIINDLERFSKEIAAASMERVTVIPTDANLISSPKMSRQELSQKLLSAARQPKTESPFMQSVSSFVSYLTNEVFRKHLRPFNKSTPLIELFVYSDSATIRQHMVGVPRAAVHTALNNPHYYLQCECCELPEDGSLVPTLPDLSVAYKLHLECGRMINLFDWLQAFRTVVEDVGPDDDLEPQVDPKIQARFTRAVAELQFLGFIKSSKRKTDHVARLTW